MRTQILKCAALAVIALSFACGNGATDAESTGAECGDDSAVREEVGAGDECRVVSEEEGGDGCDFVGGADASCCGFSIIDR